MARDESDEIRSLELRLEALRKSFEKMGSATPMRQRNGAEANYGLTYQRLVRLGARQQLKRKYRGVNG